jgi:hypothetical protein
VNPNVVSMRIESEESGDDHNEDHSLKGKVRREKMLNLPAAIKTE